MDGLELLRDLLPGVTIDRAELISDHERATVHRVRARDDAGERSLIVKRYRGAGESWVRECAALATLPPNVPAPRLVAESSEPPIAVLTDLGGSDKPAGGIAGDLLADDSGAADNALVRWAQALAEVHAGTHDRREEFEAQLNARAGDLPVAAAPMRAELQSAVQDLERHCGSLGVAVPTGSSDQLHTLMDQLAAGQSALSPHDTCPDNCVSVGDRLALIDYEGAQWRNVAWDVAYLQVPWPTCWCCWRMPAEAADRALAAYRRAAATALPTVATDAFEDDLAAALLGWGLLSFVMSIDSALAGREPDFGPDRPTPPRRAALLHRLDRAAGVGLFPALAELAARLAVELRSRWGDGPGLALAPAYRPGE